MVGKLVCLLKILEFLCMYSNATCVYNKSTEATTTTNIKTTHSMTLVFCQTGVHRSVYVKFIKNIN